MPNCLEYIYAEHFLEHLPIKSSFAFLDNAKKSLVNNGKIRLSTPSLEWVLATHFPTQSNDEASIIEGTFSMNRAFYGWGHSFLYSQPMLKSILKATGFSEIHFCDYGISTDPNLCQLEKHGGYSTKNGFPSVWIIEAQIDKSSCPTDYEFMDFVYDKFVKYVDGGH